MSINVLDNDQFQFGYLLFTTFPLPLVKLTVERHQVAVSHPMCNQHTNIFMSFNVNLNLVDLRVENMLSMLLWDTIDFDMKPDKGYMKMQTI